MADEEINNLSMSDIERIAAVVNAYEAGDLTAGASEGQARAALLNGKGTATLTADDIKQIAISYDGFIAAKNDTGAALLQGQLAVIRGRDNDGNLLAILPDTDNDPAAVLVHSEEIPSGVVGLFVTAASEPAFAACGSTGWTAGTSTIGPVASSAAPTIGQQGFLVVAPGVSTTGAMVMRVPIYNAENTSDDYSIDRTSPSDDGKSWNPAANLPQNWKTYSTVTLTTATLRFNASNLPELAKVKETWSAPNAPVIAAVTSSEISDPTEEFECENA